MSNEPVVASERRAASLDLPGLLRLGWRERRRILVVGLACAIVAAVVSLTMRPVFRSSTLLASSSGSSDSAGLAGLVGQLAGGIGAAAGLDALIQPGGKVSLDETLAFLNSRDLTLRLVRELHAEPVLFRDRWNAEQGRWKTTGERGVLARLSVWFAAAVRAVTGDKVAPETGAADGGPSDWDLFERFDELRTLVRDKRTNLVTLSISWRDPVVAASWTNQLVKFVNERLRERAVRDSKRNIEFLNQRLETTRDAEMMATIYRMLEKELKTDMAVNLREEFALKVIDPAVPPRTRSSPHRTAMTIAGLVLGCFLGLIWVLWRDRAAEVAAPGSHRRGRS